MLVRQVSPRLACALLIFSIGVLASSNGRAAEAVVVQPGEDLQQAIVKLRGTPRPVVVELAAGRHELAQPLVLTEADSGLTLRGPAEWFAILCGSVALNEWTAVAGKAGPFEAALPEAIRASPPRHLFRHGRMATRARTPNEGWLESTGKLAIEPPFTLEIPREHSVAGWSPADNIWIVGLQKWAGFKFPVHTVDAAANAVQLNGKLHAHRQEKVNRFWIENDAASLDQPGEWRIDPQRGVVQFLSVTGQAPAPGVVTVPVLSELVRLENCRDVTLQKLFLREVDDDLPPVGEVDSQAAAVRRGAVRLVGAQNVTIDDCEFSGLGGYAVDIGRGSRDCRVTECEIHHLGAGGVRIGETRVETEADALVTGHTVEACNVHDYGRTYLGACGLIVFHASGNRLARNEVHHGNYTAVSVGWTWGYRESPCHHNTVEENYLHYIGNDLLSDMGGVYLLGPQPGTVVRRNRIHDIFCNEYGGWGLYTDEGSSEMLLEENIVWNCQSAGFHQHYGRDNTVRNNLIVNCGEGGLRRSRDEDHKSFTFEHNVIVCQQPQFLSGNWKNGNTVLRNNLYYSPGEGTPTWNGRSLADWQAAGHDAGSRVADPKLVDPLRPDFGLQADSPAADMGIHIPALATPKHEKPLARRFEGLGDHQFPITTTSPEAQTFFNQGIAYLYGFNHAEAIRAFEEAARLDPNAPLPHWGVAIALGPNINFPLVPEPAAAQAWQALTRAQELADNGNELEQALIAAACERYAWPQPADRRSLDEAYAAAMGRVWKQFPDNADVGGLYAEALMDLQPWDYWKSGGEELPGTAAILSTLETVLKQSPEHPLALHLYIHAVEASDNPARAEDEADRLRGLQPGLGHMVHMPSHIDVRLGHWDKAIAANEKAVVADGAYRQAMPDQGFYRTYMAHNHHMLGFAAMMTGRRERALRAFREMLDEIPVEWREANAPFVDAFFAMPYKARLRFGQWDELLAEPEPPAYFPIARAIRLYARGVAFAAKGNLDAAREMQRQFLAAKAAIPEETFFSLNTAHDVLSIAEQMLAGEILYRAGQVDAGLAALREAVNREEKLRYIEPPDWIQPSRHALGAALINERQFAEAEAVYRADLAVYPDNGWSLFGLSEALRAQGQTNTADEVDVKFRAIWKEADIKLTSSCFCLPGVDR